MYLGCGHSIWQGQKAHSQYIIFIIECCFNSDHYRKMFAHDTVSCWYWPCLPYKPGRLRFSETQTHKRFERTLFIRTKHKFHKKLKRTLFIRTKHKFHKKLKITLFIRTKHKFHKKFKRTLFIRGKYHNN